MNALIKKEIRLLLPTWATGLGVAFLFVFVKEDYNSVSGFQTVLTFFPVFLITGLVLMMALDSFGREMSAGTFSNLLAQPVSRVRIWRTKTLLLALGILTICLVLWLALLNNKNISFKPGDIQMPLGFTAVFAMAIYSGGLWAVLLLRQVAAAFWLTILVPLALIISIIHLEQKFPGVTEPAVIIVFCLYSIAGFLFARWLFLRAQDVQWTGGVIALPGIFGRTKTKTVLSKSRIWRPRRTLFAKELQLHQSQLVIAGVLLLLHLVVVFIRKFAGTFGSSLVEFIYEAFWVLWFVMPLLVGCAAVAEERRMGTLESQLCLPVRRRTQFCIKFCSALFISIVLSLLVPLLLEGKRIIPEFEIKAASELAKNFPNDVFIRELIAVLQSVAQCIPIFLLFGIATIIAAMSFYASTLCRNTLQSLAPAVLGIVVAFFLLVGASFPEKLFHYPLWRGWLIYLTGVPVMVLILLGLMYGNFTRVWTDWKIWRRNAVVIIASLAFLMGITSAIYHRAWELLSPIESAHGVARLEKSAAHNIQTWGKRSTIHLADGRVWSTWMSFSRPSFKSVFLGDWDIYWNAGEFWNGTWASVASSYFDDVGVKQDGSLWVSNEPRNRSEFGETNSPQQPLIRFGGEKNWKSVTPNGRKMFLLKTDGTLWSWGAEPDKREKEWPGLRAFKPTRLGTNSDWVELSRVEYRTAFRKTNGETWIYPQAFSKDTNSIELDDQISIYRTEIWDGMKSVAFVSSHHVEGKSFQVGVREDGAFLVIGAWRDLKFVNQTVPLGKASDWLAVAGEGGTVVTLKSNGSLWKWNFNDDPVIKPDSASATRLGKHSDWIGIASQFGGVRSLAADGSMWFWRFDDSRFSSGSASAIPPLLAASRRPQKIGNIFDTPSSRRK